LVYTIQKLLQKTGRRVTKSTAIASDKANKSAHKERIVGDLDVYYNGKKDILDVCIVDRLLPFYNSNNSTPPSDRGTAKLKENAKIAKYRNNGIVSHPREGLVVPIAIEALGKMGKIGYDYLVKAAEKYEKGYKRSTIKRYWFSKISVALHNAIGNSANIHIQEINTGNIVDSEEDELLQEILNNHEIGVKRTSLRKGLNSLSK
jgi:hypothetical protein